MSVVDAAAVLLRRARTRLTTVGVVETTMLALASATGLATGLLAAGLVWLVRSVQRLAFGGDVAAWELLVVPTVGALVVGILLTYWSSEPSGSGVVQIMESLALRGGRIRRRVAPAGLVSTGVALGTGASGGREGPIVLIGGSVGSWLGQVFRLDEEHLRSLMAAGAAAGIGASFNAPIGGMLFAIELIVGGLRARSLQVIVVASVIGSVTARQIIGEDIIYQPRTTFTLGDPRELVLYVLLGLAAAAVGLAFVHGTDVAMRLFGRLDERVWRPLVLAAGGLFVGAVALAVPEVLGTGDELPAIDGFRNPIQAMIDTAAGLGSGWVAVGTLLVLLVAKLVATLASVGSGNAVGIFAPALFTGAALGGAFGAAAATLLPEAGIEPGAFALVGMAAVFSAAARTPLTAILIVFELTNDYELVLPLMLAAGIATFLGDRLSGESIYTLPLKKRGIVYGQPEDVDIMQTVRVREVMTTTHPSVPEDLPLPELREMFRRTRSHGFAVVDGEDLAGIVAVSDLARAETHPDVRAGRRVPDQLTAADVCTTRVLTVQPDDPVYRALQRMAAIDVGRMPVVAPGTRRLLGLVRRGDVVQAYQRAISRSLGEQQRQQSRRLRDLAGVRFVEYVVDRDSAAAGQCVRDVSWPQRTVLTSIRRGGEVIMPQGDTVLEPGDEVVVLTALESTDDVRKLIGHTASPDDTATVEPG